MKMAPTFVAAAVAALCLTTPALAAPGGFLGVYLTEDDRGSDGALIEEVAPDSPAAKAGLRKGDRIVAVGDREVGNSAALIPVLVEADPGQTLDLRIDRDGWQKAISVTLARRGGAAVEETPAPQAQQPKPAKERGFLGIYLRQSEGGDPVVDGVMESSPAAKAGLKTGDLIHSVDGRKVSDPASLISAVGAHGPDEQVTFGIRRGDRDMNITATLGRRPAEGTAPAPEARPAQPKPEPTPADRRPPFIGVALVDDGGEGPLKVDDVQAGSPAERFGLRKGDVVLEVEDQPVETIEDFVEAIDGKYAGDTILVRIERDGWRSDVRMTLGARE